MGSGRSAQARSGARRCHRAAAPKDTHLTKPPSTRSAQLKVSVRLHRVARTVPVGVATHGWPFLPTQRTAAGWVLVELGRRVESEATDLLGHAGRRHVQFLPTRHCIELSLTGLLQVPHAAERFCDGGAYDQGAMVLEYENHVVSQVKRQPIPLFETQGEPFGLVVANLPVEHHRVLAQREQATLEHRDRHACSGVQMQHAVRVRASCVNRTVNDESGFVDVVLARIRLLALGIDLDQAGCSDLVERPTKRVDEVMVRSRDTQRNMRVNQIGPSVVRGQAVASCQINSGSPLLRRTLGRR